MKAFIDAQVRQINRAPNVRMPRPSQCLIVTDLARPSLAEHAGVGPRDFLVSLDGIPAQDLPPQTYILRRRTRQWVFYARARHELITLDATGIEPGVELQRTPDGIRERFNPKSSPPTDLEVLWEARDFRGLEDLSRKSIAAHGRDDPALAFLGASLYETGRKPDGMTAVEEYLRDFAPHWTMNFAGIAYSYRALDFLDRGDRAAGLEALNTAFEHNPCPRLADLVGKITGTKPPLESPLWLGRVFPDYRLPRLGDPAPLSLSESLRALSENQLLGVCLLASYRGNGPYNDFMLRYHNFATWFGVFLPGLHVITMEATRPPDRDHYFQAEDEVKAAGLPLEMLLEDGSLTEQVGQRGSPFIVLLDRAAVVRYEGQLDSVAMWRAAAGVAGLRP